MNCPYCLSTVVTVIQVRQQARCECGRCHRRWTADPDDTPDGPLEPEGDPPAEPRLKRKR